MKLSKITDAAKKALDSRGGTDGLKRDVEKLRDIAMSEGTPKERAQRAADHLKQPQRPEDGDRPAGEGEAAGGGTAGPTGDASATDRPSGAPPSGGSGTDKPAG